MPFTRTTEHAASSYGQTVWVDEHGTAYGADDLLSPSQAADLMLRSVREVQRLCKEGLLTAVRVGSRYVIRVRDAEVYTAKRRGAPGKGDA